MRKIEFIAAAALLGLSTGASATVTQVSPAFAPVTGTFTEVLPGPGLGGAGVYGVELLGGNSNTQLNGNFEIAVGKATSQVGAGNFNQGQFYWGCESGGAAGCGTTQAFSLTWTATALSFTVGSTTVTSPDGANLAKLMGNTFKIYAKRDATFHISSIDGTAFDLTGTGAPDGAGNATNELFFYSDDNWGGNGLTVTGTVRIHGGGNSANEIMFKHGNYTAAVPEPATWALLLTGFAMTGAALRRRKLAAA